MDSEQLITLNVGGKLFCTKKETLLRSGYFRDLFELTELKEGPLFVDRSGKAFESVLEYLRDERRVVPLKYRYELDFYRIEYVSKGIVVRAGDKYLEVEHELIPHIKVLEKKALETPDFVHLDCSYEALFHIIQGLKLRALLGSKYLTEAKALGCAKYQNTYALCFADATFFLNGKQISRSGYLTRTFKNKDICAFSDMASCFNEVNFYLCNKNYDIRKVPEATAKFFELQ
jgi:hypothetical protein